MPQISPPKNREPLDHGLNATIITNSPLFSNKVAISVRKEDGYQRRWMRNRKQGKEQPLISAAEKNLAGEDRGRLNEFLEGQESRQFVGHNLRENPKNLKTLEVEISKVLSKLNEISESIKTPQNYQ